MTRDFSTSARRTMRAPSIRLPLFFLRGRLVLTRAPWILHPSLALAALIFLALSLGLTVNATALDGEARQIMSAWSALAFVVGAALVVLQLADEAMGGRVRLWWWLLRSRVGEEERQRAWETGFRYGQRRREEAAHRAAREAMGSARGVKLATAILEGYRDGIDRWAAVSIHPEDWERDGLRALVHEPARPVTRVLVYVTKPVGRFVAAGTPGGARWELVRQATPDELGVRIPRGVGYLNMSERASAMRRLAL